MAISMGGTMLGPRLCAPRSIPTARMPPRTVPSDELALLDEIGDTIIPATDVPGAKAVGIGAFIAMMVRDCYEPVDQANFAGGVRELAENFRMKYGRDFVGAPAADRTDFLNLIDLESEEFRAQSEVGWRGALFPDPERTDHDRLFHLGSRSDAGAAVHGSAGQMGRQPRL